MWKVKWIPFIVKNNLQDPRLWQSLFSCYIAWVTPWLPFHSCNYDIFIPAVRTARGRTAFTSTIGIHFLCNGDAAAILEAHFHTTLTTILLCEFLASVPDLLQYMHLGLRACCSIRRVVFSDHSIVFEPCFALCFLRIPKNALYHRERKTLLTYWHKKTGTFEMRSGSERMHTWRRTPSTGRNFQTLIIC